MSRDPARTDEYAARARAVLGYSRRWQIAAAAAMMAAVSPYQYVWSSIQGPMAERLDVALPALAGVFSAYVLFQSLSQFPAGWWRDRRGPRALTVLAGVLAGGSYVGLAYATQLWQLYLLYSLGSVGVGIVYTVAVNTAVKWFPERRGLTTGVGTMAFAAGSTLVVPYVRANATVEAYPRVLWTVGLLMLVVLLAGALVLRDPPPEWRTLETGQPDDGEPSGYESTAEAPDDDRPIEPSDGDPTPDGEPPTEPPDEEPAAEESEHATEREERTADAPAYTWREMLGTWQFWLLYASFVAVSTADLLVIAQVVDFAEHLGFTAAAATVAATLLPLSAGGSRLVLGELSDRFRREHVMAVSFALAGAFRLLLVYAGIADRELLFVLFVVLAIAFSSPLYVYFPSLVADYYGTRYSSGNYALLYTAKIGGGIGSGALAGLLVALVGWTTTFALGGVVALGAGLAATVLRPPGPQGDADAGI